MVDNNRANLNSAPIGVFDSGIGGLAVARYLRRCLPKENFIFFGDTAHLPYGDRQRDELLTYTKATAQFLLAHHIKALVIACNTISTVAGDWLQTYLNLPVINVIDPIAQHLSGVYTEQQSIGLVGTQVTVSSGVYEKRIRSYGGIFPLASWALTELVPMIEAPTIDYPAILALLNGYAQRLQWSRLTGLILGCTHYPWVESQFRIVLGDKVDLWDAGAVTAAALKTTLAKKRLLIADDAPISGHWCFYLSAMRSNIRKLIANFWPTYELQPVVWQHNRLLLLPTAVN